jgi:uncharacterized protein (TIGR00369 family)
MEVKRVGDSQITLTQLMQPEHVNVLGNVHGGVLMKMMDEAGGLCAARHARRPAVTVVVDTITFLEPIRIGELVMCTARLTFVGRTSMEAEVRLEAEDILAGNRRLTNVAYIVYVALGDDGHPTEVSPLLPTTEEERQRWEAGRQRRAERLTRKAREG